jgi:hypothetical protein
MKKILGNLSFPVHHKHKQNAQSYAIENTKDIDGLDIEEIVSNALGQAHELAE